MRAVTLCSVHMDIKSKKYDNANLNCNTET